MNKNKCDTCQHEILTEDFRSCALPDDDPSLTYVIRTFFYLVPEGDELEPISCPYWEKRSVRQNRIR